MWSIFFIGIIACISILYLPGYFVFRALSFSRFTSLITAPIMSISVYGITSILFGWLNIPCNWMTMFFGWTIVCLLSFLIVNHFSNYKNSLIKAPRESENHLWLCLILCLSVSIVITFIFFVKTLDGPESFVAGNDATTHLNTIRLFIDSGNWSSLSGGTYYPSGYSELSAMISQSLGVSAPFSANILVTVTLFAILPLSMFGFLSICFYDKPKVILCGCFTPLALTAFPWNFLTTDQLGPNLLGFATVPTCLMLILILLSNNRTKHSIIKLSVAIVIFAISTIFTHPCAFFTAAVLLIPFGAYKIFIHRSNSKNSKLSKFIETHKTASILFYLAAIAAVWISLYYCPLLKSVTSFVWPSWMGKLPALECIITLSFADNPAQWMTAGLVAIGIIFTFFKRKYLWITVGFLIFCFMYFIGTTTDGAFKQILIGFWYTSVRRLAASAAIAGVPLLTIGLYAFIQSMNSCIYCLKASETSKHFYNSLFIVSTLIAFCVINYLPSFTLPEPTGKVETSFGYIYDKLYSQNNNDQSAIDSKERAFLEQVKNIVDDSLVYNIPQDGSAYAYSLKGINTYEQRMIAKSDESSIELRKQLNNINSNEKVRNIVDSIGLKYVLLLDYGIGDDSTILKKDFGEGQFDAKDWPGVLTITDETPGFELILKDGDMRLYKITE